MTISVDRADLDTFRAQEALSSSATDVDPITTEIIRHGLNSAANQMKRVLVRAAFSPVIYETLDFAVAIYDRNMRLLAQAPSLPIFMGTLSFCAEAAVAGVGGEENLAPGDILLYNWPYGTGSHAQDGAVVMPVFLRDDQLIAHAVIKAHWLDIGGKEPYATDTVDVFQEGTFFPGVKLYRRGELNQDVYRIALANSRLPKVLVGDIAAEVAAVRTAALAVIRLVERYGLETFEGAVERMYDHGEAVVRSYLNRLPDGRYIGRGQLDSDGISDDPIPFEISVEIDDSTCRIDFSDAPDAVRGPLNTPIASTLSAARIAVALLAGAGEEPNEGHFRPLEVVARRGSLFHPNPPSPCFLYGWPAMQAMEVIFRAFAQAMPDACIACCGGSAPVLCSWGVRSRTGEAWGYGSPFPNGQGARANGDGVGSIYHFSGGAARFNGTEVMESKFPWLMQKVELAPDSGGAGKFRGGVGIDLVYEHFEHCYLTPVIEQTKSPPWGLEGGSAGRPHSVLLTRPDGTQELLTKSTGVVVDKGTLIQVGTAGGGGYGPAGERDTSAVHRDLREGYITEPHARKHYPHAFAT